MDLWPDAPSPATDPDFPGVATTAVAPTAVAEASLSPFEIASGIIDLPPSPSELLAAAAMMRAAYALSATIADKAPRAPKVSA
ncbi:hypothetical protein [Nitrospirillum bahiense]|uniref:Uncharacterized protein n=1 Tax=Nitrospirillum amazonense TaxID=28077 RepID=A0A560GDU1_9PROT|nr:hypothetical protein [Nitrospirillum amazonense]TWB31981.1 hypothetical protein FBZ88_101353 [Nitrospirillum amazonense]